MYRNRYFTFHMIDQLEADVSMSAGERINAIQLETIKNKQHLVASQTLKLTLPSSFPSPSTIHRVRSSQQRLFFVITQKFIFYCYDSVAIVFMWRFLSLMLFEAYLGEKTLSKCT